MSRSKSRQAPHAWQWNPPEHQEFADESFHTRKNVQSVTECTGLMTHVPDNEGAAESISSLYAIHALKPQGNVGKDNPRNDPSEIEFHRQ
ncbi:MAG: hypothetical protein Q4F18_07660 [Clostridia bacterium]|nr:hypothetical protein [Clostridia bacterium]